MSTNTSPKLKLLLILDKCRPMLRLTKQINEVIPCGPYLPHVALRGIFHLVLGG
jgi:hypothetical protein